MLSRAQTPWTDDDRNQLIELWYLRPMISVTKISKKMNRSRNSIIGAAHRLGLERRRNGFRSSDKVKILPREEVMPRTPRKRIRKTAIEQNILPIPEFVPGPPGGVPIYELQMHHCRAILDMHGSKEGLAIYCGADVKEGQSFCPHHCALFFRERERKSA